MIFLFSQNKTKVYYNLKLTERFYKETTRIGFLLLTLVSMRVNIVAQERNTMFINDCIANANARQIAVEASYDTVNIYEQMSLIAIKNQLQNTIKSDLHVLSQKAKEQDEVVASKQKVLPVETIYQRPSLPNGCEITSATIVLNYLGFHVDKLTMADVYLPKQYPFYAVNPNVAYMGNPRGNGWYCYAQPLVKAINSYLKDVGNTEYKAKDITGSSVDELKQYIREGNPVVFWGTINFAFPRKSGQYVLPTGERPYVNLHCLVLKGFDDEYMYIADPLGYTNKVKIEWWTQIYKSMGSRAVIITKGQ